jgi:hypothetical protein
MRSGFYLPHHLQFSYVGHGQAMGTPSKIFLKLKKEFFHNEINMEKKIK